MPKKKSYHVVYTDSSFPLGKDNIFVSAGKYAGEGDFQNSNGEPGWKVLFKFSKVSQLEKAGGLEGILRLDQKRTKWNEDTRKIQSQSRANMV